MSSSLPPEPRRGESSASPPPIPCSSVTLAAASSFPSDAGRFWYVWCIAGCFASLLLFALVWKCNAALTATEQVFQRAQEAVAGQVDQQHAPLVEAVLSEFFYVYLEATYLQARMFGFFAAVLACIVLPLGMSLAGATFGHLLFMMGGAPGGWRGTWKSFGLHRLIAAIGASAALMIALIAPFEPVGAAAFLVIAMSAVGLGAHTVLWVWLAKIHDFGPVRIVLMGVPCIIIGAAISAGFSFLFSLYIYAYLAARTI